MQDSTFDPASASYVSLATYRRDGREVRTPVWIAGAGGKCYLFSAGDAGKVKRIRANPRARLAACDVRGRVAGGWRDARARVVSDRESIRRAYAALRGKYGWRMRVGDLFAKLTGRYRRRAIIEVEVL